MDGWQRLPHPPARRGVRASTQTVGCEQGGGRFLPLRCGRLGDNCRLVRNDHDFATCAFSDLELRLPSVAGQVGVLDGADGTDPAGDSDASSVGKMLNKHQVNLGRSPRELVGDSGYGTETALRECEARGIVPTLNQKRKGNNTGLFSIDDFTYLVDRDVYICPAGTELVRAAEHFTLGKSVYRPKGKYTCAHCALKAQCTTGRVNRQLHRSWGAEISDRARVHVASRLGQRRLRRRQIVSERIMADLKVKHGFERAQFRR